jgi:hypothetical protein
MISEHPIKILFLAANPRSTGRLRLDEEVRAIRERLNVAEHRGRFTLEQEWAARVSDIQGHLLRYKPNIVHFSGHGSNAGETVLEDDSPEGQAVPLAALSNLFAILKGNISCVVLNACFTEPQADAIAETIDCVIGMSGVIDDNASISFAAAFYQGLGYGESIQAAFELGCNQLHLLGLPQKDIPKLIVRPGVEPDKVYLIDKPPGPQPLVADSDTFKPAGPGPREEGSGRPSPQGARNAQSARSQIFISYSRKDLKWLEMLKTVLKPVERVHGLAVWDATDIRPGSDWHEEIAQAIDRAKVAVLLVSRDFLASDYIAKNELPPLLDAAKKDGVRILWIAVSPVLYRETVLGGYQAANDPEKPLSRFTGPKRDEELVKICAKILEAAREAPALEEKAVDAARAIPSPEETHETPRGPRMPEREVLGTAREDPVGENESIHPRPNRSTAAERRVDAAVPDRANVGESIELLVQVRFVDSPLLGCDDQPCPPRPAELATESGRVALDFPIDPQTGLIASARVKVQVVATCFKIHGKKERTIEVPPDKYSGLLRFPLTARNPGVCTINLRINRVDDTFVDGAQLVTHVGGPGGAVGQVVVQVFLLVDVGRLKGRNAEVHAEDKDDAFGVAQAEDTEESDADEASEKHEKQTIALLSAEYGLIFLTGVLGNLAATLLQDGPLRSVVLGPRIAATVALAAVFLAAQVWVQRRWSWSKLRIGAAFAIGILVVSVPLWILVGRATAKSCGDLQTSCIELDLMTGAGQRKCSKDPAQELKPEDVGGLRIITGRAVLPVVASSNDCDCVWQGWTDKNPVWESLRSGRDCTFSMVLPSDVGAFHLKLTVDKSTRLFAFRTAGR